MAFKYVWDQNNPEGYYNRMGFYKTQIELQFITNNLNKNSSILDLGGGSGRFALPLIKQKHEVWLLLI